MRNRTDNLGVTAPSALHQRASAIAPRISCEQSTAQQSLQKQGRVD
jgi:hypothetical protein